MRRIGLAMLAAWLAWPAAVSAHDVPDLVKVTVFFKPENGRLRMLVRVPSNAFIDFQFPILDATWLALSESEAIAAEAAKVWVADRLSLFENGIALPKPAIVTTRISRMNDPFFGSFDDALIHTSGPRLPADALVTQDQGVVDALLEVPITSANSHFSYEPRFGRLGVLVNSTVTFVRPDGQLRTFQFEGDPETFDLDPIRHDALTHFMRTGVAHFARDDGYLLAALCVGLIFVGRVAPMLPFALLLAAIEALTLMACVRWTPSAPWIPPLCGVLTAAAVAYFGTEAIVGGDGSRMGVGVGAGLIFGVSFWSGVQPLLQYAGEHPIAAGFGFAVGVVGSQLLALALAAALVNGALRVSRAPRAIVIITAAVVIHVSWRRMMDRTGALTLVPFDLPRYAGPVVFAGLAVVLLLWLTFAYAGRGQSPRENRTAA
ncbi:MAG TPA: hypothetical protein VN654_25620 [Vicinamibacterales bacterium]|nr:hypothetical protein [Vicinamibacterales bacterium]